MEKKLTPEAIAELKEKAKLEIETEKPDVAIALLNRVLMAAPDAEAYEIRADAHLLGKNYNSCFQDMDMAILIEPENTDLYVKRGVLSLILERYVDAQLDFDQAVTLDPSDPNVYFSRSLTLSALGDPIAALDDLKKCLELNQDKTTESAARIQRADILMGQGKSIDAFCDLTIALSLDDSSAEAHKHRGIIANQIGEYRLAYYDLSSMPLCQLTSENYLLRSEAAAGLGYITSADNDRFISALFQQPRLQEVVEKAISELNEANYDAALKLLDEIVSLLPQDVSEILYLRAKMKLELNQKAEAIADLDAAIKADPLHSLKARICRVKAQVDMNSDHSQITSDFREILRHQIDAARVYMATGVLKITGNPMIAVAYLNAAMELSGSRCNPLLPFYSGLAKVQMHNYNDALLDFDRAIEIEDNSAQRVANLALRSALHGILEDYDKALLDIEKAISICMEIDGGVFLGIILSAIRRKVQEDLGLEEPVAGHDYIDFFDMMVPSTEGTEGLEHLIAIYDLTIKIDQSIGEPSTDDYLARGIMYVEIDEPEAGIADLTRVIEANPTCVKAYLARGKAYRKINQPDDSLNDFRQAEAIQ